MFLNPKTGIFCLSAYFCALSLSVCAQSSAPASATASTPTRESVKAAPLSPEDIIDINVFQEADLQTRARISQSGTIMFPLVGEIKVAGMSPETAAQAIRTSLAKDYLVNPQVTVTVAEYSKRRFTVLGQVQKPGAFEMPDRTDVNLLQAIGAAGGYTRIANASDIKVKRTENGKEVIYKINAKNIASGKEPNDFMIQTGDIITVGESIF